MSRREQLGRDYVQHAVPDAPHVHDEAILRIEAQFLPYARGVRLECPRPPERAEVPDVPQQLFLRPDSVRLRRELRDELELLRGEQHQRVADVDAPRRPVDDEVARDDDVVGRNGRSPDQCANAREELVVGERAPDDVVGAALERPHALERVGSGREHDHRYVPIPRPPGLATAKP